MKKHIYFNLQFKRAFKCYPMILFITILTIVSVALAGIAVVSQNLNDDNKQSVRIGVVGDIENSYLKIGLAALESLDSSRFFINFEEMTETEAKAKLEDGILHGYVVIPEDYIKTIWRGENVPATFVTQSNPDNFGTILTTEVTKIISNMLTETQIAVYSMQDIFSEKMPGTKMKPLNDSLNFRYLDLVLHRQNTYRSETLGIADSISFGGYYVCGIIIFFLLLWGISCNKLMTAKNVSLFRSLNAFGMKPVMQVLCEYAAFLAITFVTLIILAITAGLVLSGKTAGIPELESISTATAVSFVFKTLPVIMMLTMMHTALYELVSGTVSAILLQFLVSVVLGYLSGCFYPNSFFPDAVQRFTEFLPSGIGFSYLRKTLSHTLQAKDLWAVALYFLAFAGITIGVRKHRIAGENQ